MARAAPRRWHHCAPCRPPMRPAPRHDHCNRSYARPCIERAGRTRRQARAGAATRRCGSHSLDWRDPSSRASWFGIVFHAGCDRSDGSAAPPHASRTTWARARVTRAGRRRCSRSRRMHRVLRFCDHCRASSPPPWTCRLPRSRWTRWTRWGAQGVLSLRLADRSQGSAARVGRDTGRCRTRDAILLTKDAWPPRGPDGSRRAA